VVALIVVAVLVVVAVIVASRTIRIIPQARAAVLERLGRYHRTLEPGLTFITPFVDRVRPMIDLREQVVNFKPQAVITEDNVVVAIETVLYFQITDARAATYEIASPLQAIEQLTVTTLRNVIGGLTLEQTLTSREGVNTELRTVLDEATGKWGIRVSRVEIKSVDPPADIKAAMEKQMRAERDRRAAILTAEGTKQAAILTAEGEKQAAVLTAEGQRQAAILRAEGEAKAIGTVFEAIHAGDADRKLLAYQYLQMLPKLAEGESNKVFVIPSEFTQAFSGIGDALAKAAGTPPPASANGAVAAPQEPGSASPALPPGDEPAA
jgi:regulator of protease activity HflC (stomatin/prohibitin superfamily)